MPLPNQHFHDYLNVYLTFPSIDLNSTLGALPVKFCPQVRLSPAKDYELMNLTYPSHSIVLTDVVRKVHQSQDLSSILSCYVRYLPEVVLIQLNLN
jgi:hypothetical protein